MKIVRLLSTTLFIIASAMSQEEEITSAPELAPMDVYRENITMSGFSSGGSMAQMFQISYSSLFQGIAVFSHTFYRCGPPIGDIDEFDRYCTTLFNLTESELYNTSLVHQDIQEYLSMGLIEDPNNLKGKRLYVYTGLRNVIFSPSQSLKILQVYEPYIQSAAAVKIRVQDTVQLLPSSTYGGPCNESVETTEFIGNCGFSGVTEAVNFLLYGETATAEAFETQNTTRGTLQTFDQTEFTKDLTNHNMDDIGYYYIPEKCKAAKCYLHFYFHGCLTGREFNGARHVENTGLLELAERKGMIVIFPQAKSSVPNPIGCWDTFGVAGKYYATQQGPQVTTLKRILDKILSGSVELNTVTTNSPAEVEPAANSSAASRLTARSRSGPTSAAGEGYNPQKLKPQASNKIQIRRKLTYLPPPPTTITIAPVAALRRSAYKAVKYV